MTEEILKLFVLQSTVQNGPIAGSIFAGHPPRPATPNQVVAQNNTAVVELKPLR